MNREETLKEVKRLLLEQAELERRNEMGWGNTDMSPEKYEQAKRRCEELEGVLEESVKWMEQRNLRQVEEEDRDLITYVLSCVISQLPIPVITDREIIPLLHSCFMLGYKKGYQVKELEHLLG